MPGVYIGSTPQRLTEFHYCRYAELHENQSVTKLDIALRSTNAGVSAILEPCNIGDNQERQRRPLNERVALDAKVRSSPPQGESDAVKLTFPEKRLRRMSC